MRCSIADGLKGVFEDEERDIGNRIAKPPVRIAGGAA